MKLKIFRILLLLLCFSSLLKAQDRSSIDSLKTAVFNSEDDTVKISLLNDLAGIYFQIKLDSSYYFLDKALNIARQIDAPIHKARTFSNIGTYYYYKEEYLKSLEYIDLAFNIADEYNDLYIISYSYHLKAWIFVDIHDLNLANEFANKAMEIYKLQNEEGKYADIYSLLSTIYDLLGDFQKSREYGQKAYNIHLHLGQSEGLAGILNNMSTLYGKMNKLDSAKTYLRQAAIFNKKCGNNHWLGINYFNLSNISLRIGEIDSAEWYINKAIKTFKKVGYDIDNDILIAKANIALERRDTLLAILYYDSIVNSSAKIEDLTNITGSYDKLYQIAKAQKKYEPAIKYYEAFKLYDDSLKKGSNAGLLTLMELQIAYEKQHNKLEQEKKEAMLDLQRKSFLIILLVILIVFLGLSIYLLYRLIKSRSIRAKIEKLQIENELESKNREMTANVMTLMKKNEILSGISKKLLEIERKAVKKETKDAIGKISDEIQKSQEVELWEEFDLRFRQVHRDFYKNLLQFAPELSPNEQRMCAYLRMNISTKDISELTGLDSRTINNTRYKIRKKFNLDGKNNLVTFLSKY